MEKIPNILISFRLISLSRGAFAKVDEDDFSSVSHLSWYLHSRGYAVTRGKISTSMHRFILNAPKGSYCDHINGDKLDNRKCNLRICTQCENLRNRKGHAKSGFKGAYFDQRRDKWKSQIWVDGKHRFLGYFSTAELAAKAYDLVAKDSHGDFARLNFP